MSVISLWSAKITVSQCLRKSRQAPSLRHTVSAFSGLFFVVIHKRFQMPFLLFLDFSTVSAHLVDYEAENSNEDNYS